MNKKLGCKYKIGVIALLLSTFIACSEEEPINMAPTFNLNEVSNIMRTSVTFSGNISGDVSIITEYGFQYSLTEDFSSNLTWEEKVGDTPTSGLCQATIKGLDANERYYYRMYASTGASKVYSNFEYFQTIASSAPMLSSLIVDSIGENMVRLKCSIEDVGDEYLLEYGVGYKKLSEKTYVPVASDSVISQTNNGTVETFYVEISGLDPATRYSFRPYAKNSADSNGDTGTREGYGSIEEFETDNQLSAVVSTSEIMEGNIGMNSVTISGRVISAIGSNGVVDECGFCWSLTNSTPSIADNYIKSGIPKIGDYFTGTIENLQPSTTYYVRAYAKNTVNGSERIGYGEVYEVMTDDILTPKIKWFTQETEWGTEDFQEVTPTTIRVKAIIENYDKAALVEKGLIWDRVNGQLSIEEARQNNTYLKMDLDKGENTIDGTIENLEIGTGYYIRAYAIYQAAGLEEVGYSEWSRSVWTENYQSPRLDGVNISQEKITNHSAELVGMIAELGNGKIIERGFCLSDITHNSDNPNFNPTIGNCTKIVKSDETFISIADSLLSETEYSVRAYVVSTLAEKVDTIYSNWDSRFWTKQIIRPGFKRMEVLSQSSNSATIASGIISLGDAEEVLEKGFCWNLEDEFNWNEPSLDEGNHIGFAAVTEGALEDFSCTISNMLFGGRYIVKAYAKVMIGDMILTVYSDENYSIYSDGLDFYITKESGDETSINLRGYVYGIEKMPADVTITEIGYFWSTEWPNLHEIPDKNKATAVLNENNEITGIVTGLTANTEYHIGMYVKLSNGVTMIERWWSAYTTTKPSINDVNSPVKK